MRLLLLTSKSKAIPLLAKLHQERIYYDLLRKISFISHAPFDKRFYNGVLAEEKLIDHCNPADEPTIKLLKNIFPFHAINPDIGPAQDLELATFLENCRRFPPRSIRQQKRVELSLSAKVSTDPDFNNVQTTCTLNLSSNGCFLTNPLNRKIGDRVWLNLDELEDPNPLLSEIRWFSSGPRTNLPPGMGVKFLEASSDQIVQLEWLMRRGNNL